MVNQLAIKNYKSVKDIELQTKRVNIFIGEHNSGKSNILEALSWFSVNALDADVFSELFRFKNVGNFFHDFDGSKIISIDTDFLSLKVQLSRNREGANLNTLSGVIYDSKNLFYDDSFHNASKNGILNFKLNFTEPHLVIGKGRLANSTFRFYSFKRLSKFEQKYNPFLNPPFGENIPTLLQSNSEWKKLVSDFFRERGYRLIMKPTENEIEMAKEVNDELTAFPYQVLSETMQRFVFLLLAIETNTNSTIILDEPESNMFPFFVKDFAERIADNTSNQFFLSTHNPYLLGSLLEKVHLDEVAVFITHMDGYETKVKTCSTDDINEILSLGSGAFLNLSNLG